MATAFRRSGDARRAVGGAARGPGAWRAGVPAAIAIPELVERHGPRLYGLASRLCRNAADAEDMVQEVFLRAYRRWHTFKGESDPGTWLYAIAARSCKDRARRKGGVDRRQVAMSQLMPWREKTVMEVAAAPEGEEDAGERREAIARVQAEISRLPEHLRLPLVLKEVLEMSVVDVAGVLGLHESTVKTRLHRARLALRKAMTTRGAAVHAPAPIYEKQVCLDLLKAKMEAMDRSVAGSPEARSVPQAEVCARCRAVFRELDLVQDACVQLGAGVLPRSLRDTIARALRAREDAERGVFSKPRRGRRPSAARAKR